MTTFSDREQAIEAYYASLELTAFRERLRRSEALGLKLASIAGMTDSEAGRFAARFTEYCAAQPAQADIYGWLADALAEHGVAVSADEVRRLALAAKRPDLALSRPESWLGFVVAELMSLFRGDTAPEAPPRHTAPETGAS